MTKYKKNTNIPFYKWWLRRIWGVFRYPGLMLHEMIHFLTFHIFGIKHVRVDSFFHFDGNVYYVTSTNNDISELKFWKLLIISTSPALLLPLSILLLTGTFANQLTGLYLILSGSFLLSKSDLNIHNKKEVTEDYDPDDFVEGESVTLK